MDKKKYALIILVCIFLVGCGQREENRKPFSKAKVNIEHAEKMNKKVTKENEIVSTTHSEYIKYYTSVNDLLEVCDTIFKGTTLDSYYFVVEGMIYTLEKVKVEEKLAGKANTGEEVYIIRSGGIVPLEEYLDSITDESKPYVRELYGEYTDEELKKSYITERTTEIKSQGEVGGRSIFFSETKSDDNEYLASFLGVPVSQVFCIFSDYMGEYRELENGQYVQLSPTSSIEEVNERIKNGEIIQSRSLQEWESEEELEGTSNEKNLLDYSLIKKEVMDYQQLHQ